MASISQSLTITTTIIIILSMLSLPTTVNSNISSQELESMLSVLRSHNYNLFSNAITTSDVLYDIHGFNTTTTARSFTFFAPSDASLFALDMTSTALLYTQTLRYHIVPRRLSVSDLRRFPSSGASFHTLLPRHDLRVSRRRSVGSEHAFTVDGVHVVVPGLFYGRDVAVHGLAGILNFRSPVLRVSPVNRTVLPDSVTNSPPVDNRTVFRRPLPKLPLVNVTIPPPVPRFSPENRSGSPLLPQPPAVDGVSPAHPPGHQIHSPAPLKPEVAKLPTQSPEISLGPGNLLHPPSQIVPEVASPPMNGTVAEPVRSEKKFLEISEVSFAELTGGADVFEESGEFLATKPWAKDAEKEAETLATAPEGYWPSDEDQTDENQVTRGEFVMDHVSVQAGHLGFQEL